MQRFNLSRMGDHASAAGPVHDHPARARPASTPTSISAAPRTRRSPSRPWWCMSAGRAPPPPRCRRRSPTRSRRSCRSCPISTASRAIPAGRPFIRVNSERQDAARQGEGPLVPGAQEGRRHQARAAAGHHRPELQRRVRRRLFGALHAHRRRPEPRRAQGPRRGHPPAAAAGARRQQGRPHRRAAEKIFIEFSHAKLATLGVTPQQIFDSVARQNAVVPGGSVETSADRINLRVTGAFSGVARDRRRAGPGGRTGVPARRHRDGQARLRGPAQLHRARRTASRRSASASPCRTAPTSSRSARTSRAR